jgi:hypothetical protein
MAGMKILLPILALVLLQSDGCDTQTKPSQPAQSERPMRRFEAVSTHGTADVALDTVTGQLCRTWDWGFKNPSAVGTADIQNLPTCYSIYAADHIPTPAPAK